MKKYSGELFELLNWILKKKNPEPIQAENISPFILNRWLSMASIDTANLVNLTFNKWLFKTNLFKENTLINRFYKTILPKTNSKINYIKKNKETDKEVSDLEDKIYSTNLELSQREILMYKQTLEELNKHFK